MTSFSKCLSFLHKEYPPLSALPNEDDCFRSRARKIAARPGDSQQRAQRSDCFVWNSRYSQYYHHYCLRLNYQTTQFSIAIINAS